MKLEDVRARDERIMEMRAKGMSCREAAEAEGVPVHIVYQAAKRQRLSGKYRAAHKRRRNAGMEDVVHRFGAVEIEAGLDGGFIATVGTGPQTYTGSQCTRLANAVLSAVRRAEREEAQR